MSYTHRVDHPFEYIEKPNRPAGSLIAAALVSVALHLFLGSYLLIRQLADPKPPPPPLRYVELMARRFTEAPGPKVETPPARAPFSDANRRATAPSSSGDQPTRKPGLGGGAFVPPGSPQSGDPAARASEASSPDGLSAASPSLQQKPADKSSGASSSFVDWRSAIRDAGKLKSGQPASGGGGQPGSGGEEGFVSTGPISFETQWYDWGDYARSMVSKIRVHWYANMPPIIRMGVRGVVTIRFTIQRNGTITDVTILQTSDIPPYDFAAKKAIELASPLAPLPADFPSRTERVTARFYYNITPPDRIE